jgi:uncharacterized membrane protein
MLNYINYFNDIPPQLATVIIAALPVAENRVSVPLALGVYYLPVWQALFFSILGSVLAAACVVYGLHFIYRRLQGRLGIGDRILQKIFERTERKFTQKYQRWGELALLIFVAVPLPMTGAWTGSIAAFLFGIKPARALLFISIGVILSAGIMALLSLGIIHFI